MKIRLVQIVLYHLHPLVLLLLLRINFYSICFVLMLLGLRHYPLQLLLQKLLPLHLLHLEAFQQM
jgi:hypothetical protein